MRAAAKPGKATKSAGGAVEALVTAVGETTDVDGLKKALRGIAKIGTTEAYAALWTLAMNPPKLPFPNGLSFIAWEIIYAARKRTDDVRALLIEKCKAAPDDPRWTQPLLMLGNIASDDKNLLADPKLCELLRRTIAFETLADVRSNSISSLLKHRDPKALPLIVAAIDRMGPDECYLLDRIAATMLKLKQVDAAGLAKLRAARTRLDAAIYSEHEDLDAKLDKLAKLVGR